MNKRIREKLDAWDFKSVGLTIIFFSIALFLFFYFTDIRDRFRSNDKEKFKAQTTGEIIDVQKIERISQSKWSGTKIYIDSYKVTYRHTVKEQKYQNVDIVTMSTMNHKLLTRILERGANDNCIVRFDTEDPKKSLLKGIE